MPATLPEHITNRLIMAKYQLSVARREVAMGTDFGAWQASIMLHDAADTFFQAVATTCGIDENLYLRQLPARIEEKTKIKVADSSALRDLNEVRNGAKHRGAYPSTTEVRRLTARIQQMMEATCLQFFKVPLSEISLSAKIEDPETRSLVQAAEQQIADGKYTDALKNLRHAWLTALPMWQARLLPGRHELHIGLRDREQDEALEKLRTELDEFCPAIREDVDLVELRIDMPRYRTFLQITPDVMLSDAGTAQANYLRGDEEVVHTEEAAHFALTFVVDTLLQFQEFQRQRLPGSVYRLRVREDTHYFAASGPYDTPAGQLHSGDTIPEATYGLGPGEWGQKNSWNWTTDSDKPVIIPYEASMIVQWLGPEEARRLARLKRFSPPSDVS